MQAASETTNTHATAAQQQAPEPRKLSRFFHSISQKLKLAGGNLNDHDLFVGDLNFNLDFIEIVMHPPTDLIGHGALCMQTLERVQKVFVVSKDEVKGVGSVVNLEVTVAARKDVPVQGIFRAGTATKTYILSRPFNEYRKLRKLIQFLMSCKPGTEHAREHERYYSAKGDANEIAKSVAKKPAAPTCPYCAGVGKYAQWCWEQPPLLATNVMSKLALFKKLVLTNSLAAFVHAARSQFDAEISSSELERSAISTTANDSDWSDTAPTYNSSDSSADSALSVADSGLAVVSITTPTASSPTAATDGNSHNCGPHQLLKSLELPPATQLIPFCPAQAKLAILLHDFFQLQEHV